MEKAVVSQFQEPEYFEDSKGATIEISGVSSQDARDDEDLAKLGKKAVLKRSFGFFSMLGLVSTVMVTWEGILVVLAIQLTNGGFAGSIYGYLVVWVGMTAAAVTMAELASMAPTAGGQYHWVSILAPQKFRIFLSYLIGWLTTTGWQATMASVTFLTSQMFLGLAVMANPGFEPKPWQTMLVFWATLAVAASVNTFNSKILSRVEATTLILHVCGFVVTLVVLAYYAAPQGDPTTVFTSFSNGGDWPDQGLSFLIGLLGPAFAILGSDGPVHMSEEISNAAVNVPRTMVIGTLFNGALGFAMLVVALLSIGNLEDVLKSPTGYPFMAIYEAAIQNKVGAVLLAALPAVIGMATTMSIVATASRMTWSFARDRGLIGWTWIMKVERRSQLPLNAVGISCLVSVLLSLIILGSSVAMNDILSLSITGLYASYLAGTDRLMWGPWRVQEPWGTLTNLVGCCYLLILFFFSFWPVSINPAAAGINFSSLILGVIIISSLVYYYARSRKEYSGPVVEIE